MLLNFWSKDLPLYFQKVSSPSPPYMLFSRSQGVLVKEEWSKISLHCPHSQLYISEYLNCIFDQVKPHSHSRPNMQSLLLVIILFIIYNIVQCFFFHIIFNRYTHCGLFGHTIQHVLHTIHLLPSKPSMASYMPKLRNRLSKFW